MNYYIGLDVGRSSFHYFVADETGKRVTSGASPSTREALESLVSQLSGADKIKVGLETGTSAFRLARALIGSGAEVMVIDSRKNALIRESTKKTDRQDAKQLCEQVRLGIHPEKTVYVPTLEEEENRKVVQLRATLIKTRTRTALRAIRIADGYHYQQKKSALSRRSGWEAMLAVASTWSPIDVLVLKQLFSEFLLAQQQLEEVENYIHCYVEERAAKEYALLTSVPMIGPVTAVAFLARIGNPNRFNNSREVCAYIGLVPRLRESGKTKGGGSITKSGNTLLRSYLVQAAMHIARRRKNSSDPLVQWYERILKRRGWKKARTALARKLAGIMYGVLKSGKPFTYEIMQNASATAA
jgi:transposase